jgi:hypothetical protein
MQHTFVVTDLNHSQWEHFLEHTRLQISASKIIFFMRSSYFLLHKTLPNTCGPLSNEETTSSLCLHHLHVCILSAISQTQEGTLWQWHWKQSKHTVSLSHMLHSTTTFLWLILFCHHWNVNIAAFLPLVLSFSP